MSGLGSGTSALLTTCLPCLRALTACLSLHHPHCHIAPTATFTLLTATSTLLTGTSPLPPLTHCHIRPAHCQIRSAHCHIHPAHCHIHPAHRFCPLTVTPPLPPLTHCHALFALSARINVLHDAPLHQWRSENQNNDLKSPITDLHLSDGPPTVEASSMEDAYWPSHEQHHPAKSNTAHPDPCHTLA